MRRFLIGFLLIGCATPNRPKDWDYILKQSVEERGLRAGLSPIRCSAEHWSLHELLDDAYRTCRTYYGHGREQEAIRELDAILESFFRTRPCIDSDPSCRVVTDLVQRMEYQLREWQR